MELRRTYELKDVRTGDHSSVQEPDASNVHRRVYCALTKKRCAVVSVIFALLAGLVIGSVFGIAPLFQSSDAPRTDDVKVVNSTTEIENSTHAHALFAVTSSTASFFRPSRPQNRMQPVCPQQPTITAQKPITPLHRETSTLIRRKKCVVDRHEPVSLSCLL